MSLPTTSRTSDDSRCSSQNRQGRETRCKVKALPTGRKVRWCSSCPFHPTEGATHLEIAFAKGESRKNKSVRLSLSVAAGTPARKGLPIAQLFKRSAMSLFNFGGGGDIWSSAGFAFVR